MKNNKKEKMPSKFDSYLVDVNISMLIPSAKNKKDAVGKAIQSLEQHKYVIGENFVSAKIYE